MKLMQNSEPLSAMGAILESRRINMTLVGDFRNPYWRNNTNKDAHKEATDKQAKKCKSKEHTSKKKIN